STIASRAASMALATFGESFRFDIEFSAYRRVIQQLDEVPVGIVKINRARVIAVGLGLLDELDSLRLQVTSPLVDFLRLGNDKTKVVQSWRQRCSGRLIRGIYFVERQIVIPARQVDILGIRTPFYRHFHHAGIEI